MVSLYKKIASSIQAKLLVTFLLLITALSIIIIVSSYTLTSQSVKTQVGKLFSLLMNNISDNISQEIKRVHSLCDFIFTSDEIKTAILSKGNSMEWENSYNAYFQIKQYVMSNPSEYVNSITITGFNGFNLSYGINYIGSMPEWSVDIYNIRKKVTDANGRIVWSDLRKIPLFPQNKNSVIVDELSVYRIIKDKQYRENIGIVNISANPRLFSQYLATLKSVSEQLGVMLPEEDYDTFGGFVFGILGFIPEDGSTPELEGYGLIIKVIEIKEHQLEKAVVCLESTSGSAAEPSEA